MSAISDATDTASSGLPSSGRGFRPNRGGGARGAHGAAIESTPASAENRSSLPVRSRGRFTTRGGPRGGRGRGQSGGHENNSAGLNLPPSVVNEAGPRGGASPRRLGRGSRTRGSLRGIPNVTLPIGQEPPDSHTVDIAGLILSSNQHSDGDGVMGSPSPVPNNMPHSHSEDLQSPHHGVRGRTIKLRANCLPIQITQTTLYLYHVRITPGIGLAGRAVKRRIFELAEQTLAWQQAGMVGTVAHNTTDQLVSSHQLPQPLDIDIAFYREGSAPHPNDHHYTLSIVFVKQLDTSSLISYLQGGPEYRNYDALPIIYALNLAHTTARGQTGVAEIGRRQFFHASGTPISLDAALEVWRGYRMSVIPAPEQLIVKVDVCTTSFHAPGNLAFRVPALQATRSLRMLRGIRVTALHSNSPKIVKRVATGNSSTVSLETPDFGQVTVQQYIQLRHNIQLQFPQLPLVEISPAVSLPPEVCTVLPGQPFRGRPSDAQSAMIVQIARRPPNINAGLIHQLSQQPVGPVLQSFGIQIGPNLVTIPGRVLTIPNIVYSTTTAIVDDRAQWNMTQARFIIGARLDHWAVLVVQGYSQSDVSYGPDDPALRDAVDSFREVCIKRGMHISPNPTYTYVRLPLITLLEPTLHSTMEAIKLALLRVKPKPHLVMAVLFRGRMSVYGSLKYLCDVILDVPSICVLSSTLRALPRSPGYDQYFTSIAMKLNIKLGGINYRLTGPEGRGWLFGAPTMVMGMRLSHPGPGSALGTPSVAAVVASIDNYFVHYPASLSLQRSRVEIITELTNMTIERLMLFKSRNNGTLPERILVYRGAIVESFFAPIREHEVPSMMLAFQKLSTPEKPYRPKLTIVASRKKHHTWFCAEGNGDGNPPPGTVVDRGVTSVYNFDFYLQAHGGVSGTARPTLYTVIYDENRITADEIQEVTHSLSYMYAPATQAVSLAAPIRYAELASKRGRCYLHDFHYGLLDDADEQRTMEAATNFWNGGGNVPGWGLSDTMFYI